MIRLSDIQRRTLYGVKTGVPAKDATLRHLYALEGLGLIRTLFSGFEITTAGREWLAAWDDREREARERLNRLVVTP